jgi:hypothetical protein
MLLEEIQASYGTQIRPSVQQMESYAEMANMERVRIYQRAIDERCCFFS